MKYFKENKAKYKEKKAKLKAKYKEEKEKLKNKFKNYKKSINNTLYKKAEINKNKNKNKNINIDNTNIELDEKKSKFEIPRYTKGEEIFNMVSHISGGVLAISALIITLILSIKKGHGNIAIFSSIVYSLSMLILYTMSSIYHGLSPRLTTAKKIFRKFDYISIFILIAGSYTMFSLMVLRFADSKSAWILFAIQWGMTAIRRTIKCNKCKKIYCTIKYCIFSNGLVGSMENGSNKISYASNRISIFNFRWYSIYSRCNILHNR